MSHPRLRRLLRWALLAFAGAALLGVATVATLYFLIAPRLQDVESLRQVELQQPMSVYTRDGQLMAVFGENRRYPVRIDRVPDRLKQAFIAVEDASFYEHHGVDLVGIARAVWLLATTDDERVPGGSTITQQVARQFFLSSEYSYKRKLAEMLLAVRMERELSKDEILELYLNKSFFGHRSYGIGAAAEFYFGKDLDELTLAEMAALAGIPKFPSSGNPVTNPERAHIRRNYILDRMAEEGFISEAEAKRAQAVPMHASPHEPPIQVYAPYVAEMVRREMIDRFGADALTRGYHVTTTIDARLQEAADEAIREGLVTYDRRHGWHGVEQHFDLGEDETPAEVSERLGGIYPQAGMYPAIVLGMEDGVARLVLREGEVIELGPEDGWDDRSPARLELARGDLVRVRHGDRETESDAPAEAKPDTDLAGADEEAGATAPPEPDYKLTQIPRAQAALVSLNPDSGALLALSGGFSFVGSKFNRATQARRQPGSSFKPLLYAAAFERGFNPASIVLDAPVVFRDRAGNTWRPQNDDGEFRGPMRLREALVQSRNLVSVRLLDAIGVDYARKYISHFGFDIDNLPPNLSMSLGTASLTPMSMARAYSVFANGGFRIDPWFISQVKDRDGAVVYEAEPAVACRSCSAGGGPAGGGERASQVVDGFNLGPAMPAPQAGAAATGGDEPATPTAGTLPANIDELQLAPRAIDARIAYQVVSMLRDVVQRGTGTRAKVLGREDVGGKTGSTNDYRDAWFSGLADNVVTSVWVGRDDFQSLGRGEYGGRAALPIWINYMREALEGRPIAPNIPPEGMVKVQVAANGSLLPEGATGGVTEWIKVEDLERMRSYAEYDAAAEAEAAAEETFDIF